MKKNLYLLIIAGLLIAACQTKTSPVSTSASKDVVASFMEKYNNAFNTKDLNLIDSCLDKGGLFLGTDPKEFWSKDSVMAVYKRIFTDTSLHKMFTIKKRDVQMAPDGNSAMVTEQMIIKMISPKIPLRAVSHVIKTGEGWKIDYNSLAFIPKNEDIPKLDKALE